MAPWSEKRCFYVFGILTLIYCLGELLQQFDAGPIFIRWYLSDFGFAFVMAFFLTLFRVHPLYAVILGGLAGITYELVQFFEGEGDPIDVVCLVLGTIVGLLVIWLFKPRPRLESS